jgi:hypothetical protein
MGIKLVVFTYLLIEFITFTLQAYKFTFNLLQMNSQTAPTSAPCRRVRKQHINYVTCCTYCSMDT